MDDEHIWLCTASHLVAGAVAFPDLHELHHSSLSSSANLLACTMCISFHHRPDAYATLQELALLEFGVLNFPPSVVAAASLLLAQSYDNIYTASAHLQRLSGYTPQLLGCCMEELLSLQSRCYEASDPNSPFLAVKDKYQDFKWHCVSSISPHSQLPERVYQSVPVAMQHDSSPDS